MEPSPKTYEQVGRLCAAWSYLEAVTEHTLWGVLEADQRWGEIVSARLDLQGYWKLILEHASGKLDQKDLGELRSINKSITTVSGHRNIIVHGRIHALVQIEGSFAHYDKFGPDGERYDFARVPCWTIFKGPDAGKSFPISIKAVEIVRTNIQSIARRVTAFAPANSGT
jgi:hypothetical protein